MSGEFYNLGKQVLLNGKHYADAASVEVAEQIVYAGNTLPKLFHAAHAYFHATTDRTSRLAAPALSEALRTHPQLEGQSV